MKPKRNYKPGPLDNCQTPGYAASPLDWNGLGQFSRVWECAAGEGNLARALKNRGYDVWSTDLLTGWDFLTEIIPRAYDVIVTNPPYSIKYKFIQRCYQLQKPWALLVPVETLGASTAQREFRTHLPDIGVILMDKRINFKMPNKGWDSSAQFPTAWITWRFGWTGLRYYEFGDEYENEIEVDYED